jgi:hypothetical protein
MGMPPLPLAMSRGGISTVRRVNIIDSTTTIAGQQAPFLASMGCWNLRKKSLSGCTGDGEESEVCCEGQQQWGTQVVKTQ